MIRVYDGRSFRLMDAKEAEKDDTVVIARGKSLEACKAELEKKGGSGGSSGQTYGTKDMAAAPKKEAVKKTTKRGRKPKEG